MKAMLRVLGFIFLFLACNTLGDQWDPDDDTLEGATTIYLRTNWYVYANTIGSPDGGPYDYQDCFRFYLEEGESFECEIQGSAKLTAWFFDERNSGGEIRGGGSLHGLKTCTIPADQGGYYIVNVGCVDATAYETVSYNILWKKSVSTPPPTPSSLVITGLHQVPESSGTQLSCTAFYTDGTDRDVTSEVTWSVTSSSGGTTPYASISSSGGYLTTSAVSSDQYVTVRATLGSVSKDFSVTIKDGGGPTKEVTSVEIWGNSSINEGTTGQYRCLTTYSDGSSELLTTGPSWDVNPKTYASISSSGVLTVSQVPSYQNITVSVSHGGKSATKSVQINNIAAPPDEPGLYYSRQAGYYGYNLCSPSSGHDSFWTTVKVVYKDPNGHPPQAGWPRVVRDLGDGISSFKTMTPESGSYVNGMTYSVQWYCWKSHAVRIEARDSTGMLVGGEPTAPFAVTVNQYVTLVCAPTAGGSVVGIDSFGLGFTERALLASSAEYPLYAYPNDGWAFKCWDDGNTSVNRTITVPGNDVTYTAYFSELPYGGNGLEPPRIVGVSNKNYSDRIKVQFEASDGADGYRLYAYSSELDSTGQLISADAVTSSTPGHMVFDLRNLASGYESYFRVVAMKASSESDPSNLGYGATKTTLAAPSLWLVEGSKDTDGLYMGSVILAASFSDGILKYRINDGAVQTASDIHIPVVNSGQNIADFYVDAWCEKDGESSAITREIYISSTNIVPSIRIKPTLTSFAVRLVDVGGNPVPEAQLHLRMAGYSQVDPTTGPDGRAVFNQVPYGATGNLEIPADIPGRPRGIGYLVRVVVNDSLGEVQAVVREKPELSDVSFPHRNIYPGYEADVDWVFDDPSDVLKQAVIELRNSTGQLLSKDFHDPDKGSAWVHMPADAAGEYELKIYGTYNEHDVTNDKSSELQVVELINDSYEAQADGLQRGEFWVKGANDYTVHKFNFLRGVWPLNDAFESRWLTYPPILSTTHHPFSEDTDYDEDNTCIGFGQVYTSQSDFVRSIFSMPVDSEFLSSLSSQVEIMTVHNTSMSFEVESITPKGGVGDPITIELFAIPDFDQVWRNAPSFADSSGVYAIKLSEDRLDVNGDESSLIFSISSSRFKEFLEKSTGDERWYFGLRVKDDTITNPGAYIVLKGRGGRREPVLRFGYAFLDPVTAAQQIMYEPVALASVAASAETASDSLVENSTLPEVLTAYRIGRATEYGLLKKLSAADILTVGSATNTTGSATRTLPKVVISTNAFEGSVDISLPPQTKAAILVEKIDSDLSVESMDAGSSVLFERLGQNRLAAIWQNPSETISASYSLKRDHDGIKGLFKFEGDLYWVDKDDVLYCKSIGVDQVISDLDNDGLGDSDEVLRFGTDPLRGDTDGDDVNDSDEVNIHLTNPLNADSDRDGLDDGDEINTYGTDPMDADSDDDEVEDGKEVRRNSDPLDPESTPAMAMPWLNLLFE